MADVRIPPKTKEDAKVATAAVKQGSTPATPTTAGIVRQGAAVPNAAAAPTQEEFNALLNSLRTAGIIAT